MYVLGINESHNATAALLKDGQIIACGSEERFTKVKGVGGIPKQAISYCLKEGGIAIDDLDLVVFGFKDPLAVHWYKADKKYAESMFWELMVSMEKVMVLICGTQPIFLWLYYWFKRAIYRLILPFLQRIHLKSISRKLKIPHKKIILLDHHTAHAFAANYIFGKVDQKKLVITNDGQGDGTCGKVFVVDGEKWKEIASTSNSSSLSYLYFYVTQFLGLTPCRDEDKVMKIGAKYASKLNKNRAYRILKKLIWIENLTFKSKIPTLAFDQYIRKNLAGVNSKEIAAGIQKLTEQLTLQQVKSAIKQTSIKEVVLGGGLAMNTEANNKIGKALKINLEICPSPTDESTSLGAAFWGYWKLGRFFYNPNKVRIEGF